MAPSHRQFGIIGLLLSAFFSCIFTYRMDTKWNPVNNHRANMEMGFLDNATVHGGNRSQFGRLFQINKEDSEIKVELGFTIPFISIPVNTKSKNGEEKLVDVNFGALAAGGILSVASLILIPTIFEGLETKLSYGRSNDEESGLLSFLSRVDDALMDYNIDSVTCTQRAVCWLVKSAVSQVNGGNGGSMDKIVDGFSSNPWLTHMVKGTAIQQAIDNGRKTKNCSAVYSKCPITQAKLRTAAGQIFSNINY